MKYTRRFWQYLGQWKIIISYLIGGTMLLLKGNLYNNGFTDIRYVYFFKISGTVILGIMLIKIVERLYKRQQHNKA